MLKKFTTKFEQACGKYMKDKYLLIGGEPFIEYTGTTTFTYLKVIGTANSKQTMKKMYSDNYYECGGLMIIINTKTLQPVEGW